MTEKQWKLLDILDTWGGMGTIEVEIQFGEYAPRTDREDDISGFLTTRLVVAGLMRSLVKKGLATNDGCYDITDAGRELLRKHAARQAKGEG
jgi:hypothetical protein